jgi:hypothetical protein
MVVLPRTLCINFGVIICFSLKVTIPFVLGLARPSLDDLVIN